MNPSTINRNAPAGVNPFTAGYLGSVMVDAAVANGAVISGAAGALIADAPIGVCIVAENQAGGRLTIATIGAHAPARVGAAALTLGVDTYVESDANGHLVASAIAGGVWSVGRFCPELNAVGQIGGFTRIIIDPKIL